MRPHTTPARFHVAHHTKTLQQHATTTAPRRRRDTWHRLITRGVMTRGVITRGTAGSLPSLLALATWQVCAAVRAEGCADVGAGGDGGPTLRNARAAVCICALALSRVEADLGEYLGEYLGGGSSLRALRPPAVLLTLTYPLAGAFSRLPPIIRRIFAEGLRLAEAVCYGAWVVWAAHVLQAAWLSGITFSRLFALSRISIVHVDDAAASAINQASTWTIGQASTWTIDQASTWMRGVSAAAHAVPRGYWSAVTICADLAIIAAVVVAVRDRVRRTAFGEFRPEIAERALAAEGRLTRWTVCALLLCWRISARISATHYPDSARSRLDLGVISARSRLDLGRCGYAAARGSSALS